MNNFLKKNGLILSISLILVVIFVIGQIFSGYVIGQREDEVESDTDRYYAAVELVSLEYNFDAETLGNNTYIAEFTYENNTYEVFLNNEFGYTETVSGDVLDLMVYSAVKQHAIDSALLQNDAYIISYDQSTKTLVINANGYKGVGSISVEFVLNDALNGISSYTVTSKESYTDQYNDNYTGGPVPTVENTIIDAYIAGTVYSADSVSGASQGTATAVDQLLALLDLFLDSMEGGN